MRTGLGVGLPTVGKSKKNPSAVDLACRTYLSNRRRFLPRLKRPDRTLTLERKMRIIKILCGCALLAFAVATSAQTKNTISGTCAKPDVEQTVPAGDQPGHAFMIAQGKCVTKGELGGAMSKEGAFSEHREVTANHLKAWGVFVETYDSGDKAIYNYQMSVAVKDGAVQSGKGTYQATSGTGKMKGIKATGTCQYSAGTDGGTSYTCSGEYTLAGPAKAAK